MSKFDRWTQWVSSLQSTLPIMRLQRCSARLEEGGDLRKKKWLKSLSQVRQGMRCLVGGRHLLRPSLGLAPVLHGQPKACHLSRDEAEDPLGRVHLSSRPVAPHIAGANQICLSDHVSVHQDAKDLIKGCLRSNPEERLSIDEVLDSAWIANHISVPPTPLLTSKVLQQGNNNWKILQV